MPQKDFCISGALCGLRTGIRVLASVFAAVAISGCATLERLPAVTYAEARQIDILDTPDARFYVSDTNRIYDVAIKAYQRSNRTRPAQTRNFLALSGGGDDGAFGAGLLVGWSARGDRPEFDMVTGVSTGALSAPYAFLGRAYDQKLAAIYTETSAGDIFQKRATLIAAVTSDSLVDNAPLRRLIESNVDTAHGPEDCRGIRQGPAVVRSDDESRSEPSRHLEYRCNCGNQQSEGPRSHHRRAAGVGFDPRRVSASDAGCHGRRPEAPGNARRRRHRCAGVFLPAFVFDQRRCQAAWCR